MRRRVLPPPPVGFATRRPSRVIGHLNHLPVTELYDQLVDVIRSRKLRTVTLDDVFLKPEYGQ